MAESEYGGLGLSIVVIMRRYVIFKTKIKGGVRNEVKLFIYLLLNRRQTGLCRDGRAFVTTVMKFPVLWRQSG